jgi:hypothetical protein
MEDKTLLKNIFNKGIYCLGPPLDRTKLHPDLVANLDQLLASFREMVTAARCPRRPYHPLDDLYVDYIHSLDINAVAFESEEHEMIGINIGTIIFVYDACLALLSNSLVLPEIGSTDTANTKNEDLAAYICRDFKNDHFFKFIPKDSLRIKTAQYLTWIAAIFLFGHEIAHHTKGHVAFIKQVTGFPFLYEYIPKSLSDSYKIKMKIRKALECGADEHGAFLSFVEWQHFLNRIQPPKVIISNYFKLWVFSLGVLFRLSERKPTGIKDYSMYPYPTPFTRLFQAMTTVNIQIGEKTPHIENSFLEGTRSAINELDYIWDATGIYTESFSNIQEDSTPDLLLSLNETLWDLEEKFLKKFEHERDERIRARLEND